MNQATLESIKKLAQLHGLSFVHVGGSRTGTPGNYTEEKETYVRPSPPTGTTRGANYLDITVALGHQGRWVTVHINTQTRKSERGGPSFPDASEEMQSRRVIRKLGPHDLYIEVPKLEKGQTLDPQALKRALDDVIGRVAQVLHQTTDQRGTIEKQNYIESID